MSEKNIDLDEQSSLSENITNALDISYRLSDGGSLRAVGVSADNRPTPFGSSPRDVRLTLARKIHGGRNPSFRVLQEMNSAVPIQDKDWFVRLISALGRQERLWLDEYDFAEILDYACEPETPIPDKRDPNWTLEDEVSWISDVMSAIDTRHYNDVWDFEEHRQDGESYYDEWHDNTEELRR